MSMEHKAFAFDFTAFESELRDILERALETADSRSLLRFIEQHAHELADPYEGELLPEDLSELLDRNDVQQCADFALTKYYQPNADIGVGSEWETAQRLLLGRIGNDYPLLGRTVGPPHALFDPGRMGAYFQSEDDARKHLAQVENIAESAPILQKVYEMLAIAGQLRRGLYVTF